MHPTSVPQRGWLPSADDPGSALHSRNARRDRLREVPRAASIHMGDPVLFRFLVGDFLIEGLALENCDQGVQRLGLGDVERRHSGLHDVPAFAYREGPICTALEKRPHAVFGVGHHGLV